MKKKRGKIEILTNSYHKHIGQCFLNNGSGPNMVGGLVSAGSSMNKYYYVLMSIFLWFCVKGETGWQS